MTEEVFPGFKFSVFSYVVSLLRPEIVRELDLPRYGLQILPLESTVTPLDNGDYLAGWADPDETREELRRHSPHDADAMVAFGRLMHHMAMAVKPILAMIPPDPTSLSPRDLMGLLKLGNHFRSLGPEHFHALHKLMTMSSADYLDEWFEFDPLKATKSASGIIGTFLGPRSPGSAYVLLHHYMGEIDGAFRAWGFQKGGTGAISESIAGAARHFGAEIRTDAAVERVLVRNGRATGVALASGEEIAASVVVSGLDPRLTFTRLVDPKGLPEDLVDGVRRYKFRGSSARSTSRSPVSPTSPAFPERGRTCAVPSRSVPASSTSSAPTMTRSTAPSRATPTWTASSVHDRPGDGAARPARDEHLRAVRALRAGGRLECRAARGLRRHRREDLARYAPNLPSLILHRQVLTPADIETMTGLSEGNIFQGELALQQLFFLRPVPRWAKYRTPIGGYWQCGAGTHPGGGIMGASGRLAALEILKSAR